MRKAVVWILAVVIGYGLSWIITSGLVWLIFKCFSLQFSWKIATGDLADFNDFEVRV